MPFANLPGVLVNTIDNGLAARRTPVNKSTLVIGTAAQGPADVPYQLVDRAQTATDFGFSGNLLQAAEEVSTFSDNVILFRMGTSPMTLSNVGLELGAAVTISTVAVTSNVATITTSAPHSLLVGDSVKINTATHTAINGTFLVASVGSSTTFTYAITTTNIASAADTGNVQKVAKPGVALTFGSRVSTAQSDYSIYYRNGVLAVWLSGNLVFSNDTGLGLVDTGDLTISDPTILSVQQGLTLNNGTNVAAFANALTVQAAAALTGTATEPPPTLVQPVTGIGMTGRQTYIALLKALDLLGFFPVDQVFCPSVVVGEPNVAYYVPTDITTVRNNPAQNADALDWLKTTVDSFGNKVYQWANDTVDSNGNVVSAMTGVTTAAQRIAAGFYEVHPNYALANFCRNQELTQGGCLALIGTVGPISFKLADTRKWIGFLPTYNSAGVPTASGSGLLGTPTLVGCTVSRLNPLCADFSAGFRLPGLFQTVEQQYDGSPIVDRNQNKVDIGAYVHVVADQAGLSNAFKANYAGNLAGMVAGFLSGLDEKRSLTNKSMNVIQLWKPTVSQLDSLKFANVNVLRFRDLNSNPVLLHGDTIATNASDYNSMLRQRIKFLICNVVRQEADAFLGESTIDGLQLSALKTALENRAVQLQKRGYISSANFNISTTVADQRIGHAQIDVTFNPADELVQLNAFVAVSRR